MTDTKLGTMILMELKITLNRDVMVVMYVSTALSHVRRDYTNATDLNFKF